MYIPLDYPMTFCVLHRGKMQNVLRTGIDWRIEQLCLKVQLGMQPNWRFQVIALLWHKSRIAALSFAAAKQVLRFR